MSHSRVKSNSANTKIREGGERGAPGDEVYEVAILLSL